VTTNNSGSPAVQLINDGKPGVSSSLNEVLYLPFSRAIKLKMYRRSSISWRVLQNCFPAKSIFSGAFPCYLTFWSMIVFVEPLIIS